MADNAKTIKERIKLLTDEKKLREGISAEERKELKGLRAQLKEVRELKGHQKDLLKGALDRNNLERLYSQHLKDDRTFSKELSKIYDDQLAIGMKAVKGKLTEADITAQLVELEEVELEVARMRAIGHDSIAETLQEQVDIIKENLDIARDTQKASEARMELESKLDSLSGGMLTKIKGLKKAQEMWNLAAAKNPYLAIAVVLLAIGAAIFKAAKATLELKKEFGLSVVETMQLQSTLMGASAELSLMGVSAESVKATAGALIEEFGELSNVTRETLVSLGGMETTIGLAGKEAVQLLGAMEGVSGSSREAVISQIESFGAMAKTAKVAPAAVMKDLADNTDMFADFAQDGGENLAKAAIQANKLGIDMGVVSKMAESLLDFESSIESQMEASMMIGRQINTDKARQLLMAGDMAGMQEEVMNMVFMNH